VAGLSSIEIPVGRSREVLGGTLGGTGGIMAAGQSRADGSTPSASERGHARKVVNRLAKRYPEISTALDFDSPYELLIVTVISAQTTDDNVNRVSPELFSRWPDPEDLAGANPEDVEAVIFSTGFYRQKTKSIIALAQDLVADFGGVVPRTIDELTTLRGVGRKTASVVLASAFGQPAIAVDTHVKRLSHRLGLSAETDPDKIEQDLKALTPRHEWSDLSMRLIQFGRDVCDARKPRCWECEMRRFCPFEPKAREA
jgi:endonuclease-3